MKIVFLDIETTGFSRQGEYILEIAAIVCNEKFEMIDSFHEYIRPGKRIPAAVVELTGITDEKVSSCRTEAQVLMDFTEWIELTHPDVYVGHNCKSFDLSFLRERCGRYGYTFKESGVEVVDTLALARTLNKAGKISTTDCKQPTLAKFFGIDYEAHTAIEDVKALIQIYQKMKSLNAPPTRASLGF